MAEPRAGGHACDGLGPAQGAGAPLPRRTGIGLRTSHQAEIAIGDHDIAWVEAHSENYLGGGGPRIAALKAIRSERPVACHGVGLSLGSAEGLDEAHLDRLAALYRWLEPAVVSEHISWSFAGGIYLNDLLPLPYTDEALAVVCRNVGRAQERFQRSILVENPSTYLCFPQSSIPEWEFVTEVARRTGCGLLIDVNNIFVSAANLGFDPEGYLNAIPPEHVHEIHLAGHTQTRIGDESVLIDNHGSVVSEPVWALYRRALDRFGPVPTLIEWDTDIPPLPVLLDEAAKADAMQLAWSDAA